MLAIITFVSTLVIGLMPNTDIYERTINEYFAEDMVNTRTEMISEWNYDLEKGWIYEMPTIEINAVGSVQAVDNCTWESDENHGWICEMPEINVTL